MFTPPDNCISNKTHGWRGGGLPHQQIRHWKLKGPMFRASIGGVLVKTSSSQSFSGVDHESGTFRRDARTLLARRACTSLGTNPVSTNVRPCPNALRTLAFCSNSEMHAVESYFPACLKRGPVRNVIDAN